MGAAPPFFWPMLASFPAEHRHRSGGTIVPRDAAEIRAEPIGAPQESWRKS